ncbi:hypothetical protein C1903_11255 [Listeria ivanovii]|uniref:DUF2334 domain-containing protein n=1 Tax=Listeria ivanovii TaxID=1638 RepID=UPI000DA82374|nr:DUF2334 domain-containing protein [Listeria ivanovii]PZF87812.1 hypothetical protein C1905_11735 [Listeria ivanovii]PZF93001.1 hypothetical protein C1903_11255 [Listeria ivanovii]PZG03912.1 hypothetical protein C2L88_11355 [Listeria ivanovii]PZG08310.1 hypothetical protein C1901_11245 [Listeria ivanovii]PZG25124.1 hypothetical protein C1900_11550 [Listeria ivanovii]
MRKKIVVTVLLSLIIFLLSEADFTAKAESGVTVFYDSLAKDTDNEGNIDSLLRILNSMGERVTLYAWNENLDLSGASKIIVLQNKREALPDKWVQKLANSKAEIAYIGGTPPAFLADKLQLKTTAITNATITIQTKSGITGKPQLVSEANLITSYKGNAFGEINAFENGKSQYGVQLENYAYVPIFQADNTSEFALVDVLRSLFETDATSNKYALITGINPFVDFNKLKTTADTFYEKDIPFIVSAGPVFYNRDFMAAKNYAEILRYVQAKNGTIVMNVPEVTYGASPAGELETVIQKSLHFFAENEIAALGVSAELYWNFDKVYGTEGFAPFSTGVLLPNEKVIHTTKKNNDSAFRISPYSVTGDFYNTLNGQKNFPIDIVITYPFFDSEKDLQAAVSQLGDENLSDFRLQTHEVKTTKDTIQSNGGSLYVNDQLITLDSDLKFLKNEKVKAQQQAGSLEGFFSYQNTFFTIVIVLSLGIIGVLFIFGYRLYMKKYMK